MHGDDIYVGGDFLYAGRQVSMNFARWNGAVVLPVEPPRLQPPSALGAAYPNPFGERTTIPFVLEQPVGRATLEVYDVLGRRLGTLVDGPLPEGRHEAVFEPGGLPSGVYLYRHLYRLTAEGIVETGHLMRVR
jgi:hypothetical protein